MPLRVYADECVNGNLVAGLRRRGVDIVTALDESLLGTDDPQQLARAIALDRTLLTGDEDFLPLVSRLLHEGRNFPGLIFILPRTSLAAALRSIIVLVEATEAPHMRNRIEWVSAGAG